MSDEKRGRGGLTPDDRMYLRGEKELAEGSEYNRRRMIRERVENAILDFSILFNHLDPSEREKIFSLDAGREPEFEAAIEDALAFIFCGVTRDLEYAGPSRPIMSAGGSGHHSSEFLALFGPALEKAYREYDILLESAELQIESTRIPNLSAIKRNLENGKTIDPKLGAMLVQSEVIDSEQLTELAREELLDDE